MDKQNSSFLKLNSEVLDDSRKQAKSLFTINLNSTKQDNKLGLNNSSGESPNNIKKNTFNFQKNHPQTFISNKIDSFINYNELILVSASKEESTLKDSSCILIKNTANKFMTLDNDEEAIIHSETEEEFLNSEFFRTNFENMDTLERKNFGISSSDKNGDFFFLEIASFEEISEIMTIKSFIYPFVTCSKNIEYLMQPLPKIEIVSSALSSLIKIKAWLNKSGKHKILQRQTLIRFFNNLIILY